MRERAPGGVRTFDLRRSHRIISRMIKNPLRPNLVGISAVLAVLGVAVSGCESKPPYPGAFQGVVEFDERVLGFEMGGRVTTVEAVRGSNVRAGDVLAQLDDTLERTTHESRAAEAEAANAELALVRAGSRPEEVKSMEARVRAARAS